MCNTFHACQPSVNLKRRPIRNLRGNQQAGTREKCYASRPLGRDFDFLRGLAPGRLGEFSIEKYEKKRESFGHSPAKFQGGAMRFSGEQSPGAGTVPEKKMASTLVFLLRGTVNSELEIFKITQNTTSEAKE